MEQKPTNKRNADFLSGIVCYTLWGLLPLYWHLMDEIGPVVILANRIVWSMVFTAMLLLITKRFGEVVRLLRDRRKMRFMVPAALMITINWGVYIWAVNSGHVLDASLGYYLNPLVVFALGIVLFREKCGAAEWIALAIAAAGVLIATLRYGAFPWIALTLALSFAGYGVFKKLAGVSGLTSIAVETILLFPFAIAYLLFSAENRAAVSALTPLNALLLVSTGVVTAVPLILYTRGVNGLPFTAMGFLQFISPTLQLIVGALILSEPMTGDRTAAFVCFGAALLLYVGALIRRARRNGLKA